MFRLTTAAAEQVVKAAEQGGTQGTQRDAGGEHRRFAVADTLTHQVGKHQTGNTGIDMDDGAAGEVKRTH